MIYISDSASCCGCTACASICPHDAISMKPDVMGFLYPLVDESKCIGCGLCEKVCAFNEKYDTSLNLPQPDAYAARHKDMKEVETSRSGAAFIAISDYILDLGGIVYGVGYEDHFRVVHKRAVTKEERDEFKGSKYVQSDLTGVFRQVRTDLKNGLTVLFSGTPCQTAGLNAFIGKKLRENLILLDIVCHGVPGPYMWRDYLHYLEKKEGKKITYVNFRDKQLYGWKAHRESFKFNGEIDKITYKYAFYKHIMFRYSCGECKYTNLKRPSDITIADFWGWEKTDPNINSDDKGVSLVFCNTEKGRKLFEAIKGNINIIPTELENCMQHNLQRPSEIHPRRINFEKDYERKGFEYVMKKYDDFGWKYKIKRILGKIKRVVKRIICK
jgi:coenzyme F420-reducing hydrogenase beta subunit